MEPVARAGQLHLRKGSRASVFKLHMVGAGQGHLKEINMHGDQFFSNHFIVVVLLKVYLPTIENYKQPLRASLGI